jgi:translation initiation factor 1 (eIF-1/SUI1)
MNPFTDLEEEISAIDYKITIWVQTFGRKKVTHLLGWNIPIDELKQHLVNIKKKNCCNGAIKDNKDNKNNIIYNLQFQGDISEPLKKYLIENNISKEDIYVK